MGRLDGEVGWGGWVGRLMLSGDGDEKEWEKRREMRSGRKKTEEEWEEYGQVNKTNKRL